MPQCHCEQQAAMFWNCCSASAVLRELADGDDTVSFKLPDSLGFPSYIGKVTRDGGHFDRGEGFELTMDIQGPKVTTGKDTKVTFSESVDASLSFSDGKLNMTGNINVGEAKIELPNGFDLDFNGHLDIEPSEVGLPQVTICLDATATKTWHLELDGLIYDWSAYFVNSLGENFKQLEVEMEWPSSPLWPLGGIWAPGWVFKSWLFLFKFTITIDISNVKQSDFTSADFALSINVELQIRPLFTPPNNNQQAQQKINEFRDDFGKDLDAFKQKMQTLQSNGAELQGSYDSINRQYQHDLALQRQERDDEQQRYQDQYDSLQSALKAAEVVADIAIGVAVAADILAAAEFGLNPVADGAAVEADGEAAAAEGTLQGLKSLVSQILEEAAGKGLKILTVVARAGPATTAASAVRSANLNDSDIDAKVAQDEADLKSASQKLQMNKDAITAAQQEWEQTKAKYKATISELRKEMQYNLGLSTHFDPATLAASRSQFSLLTKFGGLMAAPGPDGPFTPGGHLTLAVQDFVQPASPNALWTLQAVKSDELTSTYAFVNPASGMVIHRNNQEFPDFGSWCVDVQKTIDEQGTFTINSIGDGGINIRYIDGIYLDAQDPHADINSRWGPFESFQLAPDPGQIFTIIPLPTVFAVFQGYDAPGGEPETEGTMELLSKDEYATLSKSDISGLYANRLKLAQTQCQAKGYGGFITSAAQDHSRTVTFKADTASSLLSRLKQFDDSKPESRLWHAYVNITNMSAKTLDKSSIWKQVDKDMFSADGGLRVSSTLASNG